MQGTSRLSLFNMDAVLLSDMILDGVGDCLSKMTISATF